MFNKLIPLNPETHARQGVKPTADWLFAADQMLVELVYNELSNALTALPLAFNKNGDGVWLVGLMSLMPGSNNFVTPDGRWNAAYIPALYRAHPWALVDHPDNPDDKLLCVEQICLVPASEDHPALFNEDGSPSEKLQETVDFWKDFSVARSTTRLLCKQLQEAGLLEPWDLTVQIDEQETRFEGLLRVSEDRLKALAPDTLAALVQSGALGIAYAQMLSNGRMGALQGATRGHLDHQKKRQELDARLDSLFGGSGDDMLSFGF